MDKAFQSEIDRVQQAALQAMRKATLTIQADTQQLCPVDTGTLKRSYTSDAVLEGDQVVGMVGSNVEYAIWADMKQPHLTAAVDQNRETVKTIFADALRK